jgi:hypothetical protein
MTVLERPQLLQPLHPLEGTHRKTGIGEQEFAPVHIQPQMFVMNAAATLACKRNRTAGKINRVAGQIGHHFDDVRIADLARIFDDLHERGHGNIGIVQQRQRRGIDRGRIDQRLVALDVHDHRCSVGRGRFGHAIGSGKMIGARHLHLRAEGPRGFVNALVVGGDDQLGKIARLAGPLVNMLEHGLTGDSGEGFSRETRGGKPGWYYAQNSRRHNRS